MVYAVAENHADGKQTMASGAAHAVLLLFGFISIAILMGCDRCDAPHRSNNRKDKPRVSAERPLPQPTAPIPISEAPIDFSEMDTFFADNRPLFKRIAILIKKNGKTVYTLGDIHTPFGAASCTKWLGAAAIMSLVEKGKLDLDTKIGKYIPQLRPRAKRLTLRQLLSHTGGLRRHSTHDDDPESELPLHRGVFNNLWFRNPNGNVFCYENIGFNLAGEIASRVEGKPWPQLFQDEIAAPLEMTTMYFSRNKPSLAGGARVSAAEYSRFLETILNAGQTPEGRRLLTGDSVAEMLRNQTAEMPMVCVPRPSPRKQSYGLGMWRQGPNNKPWLASHFGTSGYKVFVDFCRDLTAVFIHEYKPKRKKAGRDITRNLYEMVQRAIPVSADCARQMRDDQYQWSPPLRAPRKRKKERAAIDTASESRTVIVPANKDTNSIEDTNSVE